MVQFHGNTIETLSDVGQLMYQYTRIDYVFLCIQYILYMSGLLFKQIDFSSIIAKHKENEQIEMKEEN